MATSGEQYDLFLMLAGPRISAARAALQLASPEREAGLAGSLVPLAVDAALLGVDGLRELALAIVEAQASPLSLEQALFELEHATLELAHGDASGARVDETRLRDLARQLVAERAAPAPRPEAPAPTPKKSSPPPRLPVDSPSLADDAESIWQPTLAEDMLAAFLDECAERTDSLSERLMRLEHATGDRELIGEIFRDLHTLKGSSAFAGLTKMNRVAHQAEDLLGALRDGRRQVDRRVIDVLLEALDTLRAIVTLARTSQPITLDVRPLVARLADPAAIPAPAPATATAAVSPSAAAPATAAAAPPTAQGTLRIEFEKVDHLLNLVGEVVLARGRLSSASEVQSTILREVVTVRKRLAQDAHGLNGSAVVLGDALERLERVLRETFGEVEMGLGGLGLAVGQLRDTVMKLRMVPIA
ncbi:MAG TPA: Hpt domain-containing protein, partial [Polyangiaceae bacterium]